MFSKQWLFLRKQKTKRDVVNTPLFGLVNYQLHVNAEIVKYWVDVDIFVIELEIVETIA